MKKLFTILTVVFLWLVFAPNSFAQTGTGNTIQQTPKVNLKAVINADENVEIFKSIIFSAGNSVNPLPSYPLKYHWDMGDGTMIDGEEVVHSFRSSGRYKVRLVIEQKNPYKLDEILKAEEEKEIFVYKKLFILLSDQSKKQDKIKNIIEEAKNSGVLIHLIESFNAQSQFVSGEMLAKGLLESQKIVEKSDAAILWTETAVGVDALNRFKETTGESAAVFANKTIIMVSAYSLKNIARIARSTKTILLPKNIIVAEPSALSYLFSSKNIDDFVREIYFKNIKFVEINKLKKISFWDFMFFLINSMVTAGVPANTIIFILMLPVIVTVISIMKQIVGIRTFGVYTPSIVALSFVALGLKFGVLVLVIIIFAGSLIRSAMKHVHLLYIPRIAVILTVLSLVLLFITALPTLLGFSVLAPLAVFPMLMMATLGERFVNIQTEEGFKSALKITLETTLVSLICYAVVQWKILQILIISHPEIILLFILINIFLGKWTGLRLSEYIRFREVIKHEEE